MNILSLVYCEVRKVYKSSVFWVVVTAFSLMPGLSVIKFFSAVDISWAFYLEDVLDTFTAVFIIGFAFTTCWIFGREYTDKTINDLMVKPVSKLSIAVSKFIVMFLWNSLLTIIMFTVVVLLGVFMRMVDGTAVIIFGNFLLFMAVALLTMFVSTLSSFLANVAKGYLAPIGLIFLIIVIVNVVVNIGLSPYIPWTIPGLLFSERTLMPISIAILTITGITGFVGTVAWWRYKEQK
jgi:ABC-2 type transport system permease protein